MIGGRVRTLLPLLLAGWVVPASAQQVGAMSGKVVDTAGGVLPGVTVEARSDVLPSPRVTVTETNFTSGKMNFRTSTTIRLI